MKSEFVKAKDQTKAEYVHIDCGIGNAYAAVTELDQSRKVISCKRCGHTEQHTTPYKKRFPQMTEVTSLFIGTNNQLQELVKEAEECWLFDKDTDPDGRIGAGLKIIADRDLEDSEVSDVFQKDNFPKSYDKWDALENWAARLS